MGRPISVNSRTKMGARMIPCSHQRGVILCVDSERFLRPGAEEVQLLGDNLGLIDRHALDLNLSGAESADDTNGIASLDVFTGNFTDAPPGGYAGPIGDLFPLAAALVFVRLVSSNAEKGHSSF